MFLEGDNVVRKFDENYRKSNRLFFSAFQFRLPEKCNYYFKEENGYCRDPRSSFVRIMCLNFA